MLTRQPSTTRAVLAALLGAVSLAACAMETSSGAPACGDAQRLDTAGVTGFAHPHLAVDRTGTGLVVWATADGPGATRFAVWANQYVAGTGWQGARRLGAGGPSDPYHAEVALDGQGNGIATWWQDSDHTVWANRYIAGHGWLGAELVSAEESGSPEGAHAAIHPDGHALVVWTGWDGTRRNIRANRYDADLRVWSTPEQFTAPEGMGIYARDPRVGIDAQGNAVVVWWTYDQEAIWANHYLIASGWQTPQRLDLSHAWDPQIAVDPAGNATVIAFGDGASPSGRVTTRRYLAGTEWLGVGSIGADTGYPGGLPDVAVDAGGNVMAVWTQEDGIWANRYTVGHGWGGPRRLDTVTAGSRSGSPQVAMDERGHAAAVFKQWRDGESSVWLSRHDLAAGWGPARRLAWGTAEGSLEYPQVGLDANGTAHVVWRRFGASTSSICGLRLQ